MKQKKNPKNCFYEKPRFCLYKCTNAAENGSTQKKNCSDMDLAADLAGDVGAIFCNIEAL
jgi:hypothetical protein